MRMLEKAVTVRQRVLLKPIGILESHVAAELPQIPVALRAEGQLHEHSENGLLRLTGGMDHIW